MRPVKRQGYVIGELLVSDDAKDLAVIKDVIYAYELDVTITDGAILIGKLPGGCLRYLHKLFVPTDDIIIRIENILGFVVPKSYAQLFLLSDGATLFDNTLFLYGISAASTREVSIENARPVSLMDQVEIQRRANPDLDWIEVGSIAAATKNFSIQINRSGSAALNNLDGHARYYPTFLSMLSVLTQILHKNSGAQGLIDDSGESLQSEIESYICVSRQ